MEGGEERKGEGGKRGGGRGRKGGGGDGVKAGLWGGREESGKVRRREREGGSDGGQRRAREDGNVSGGTTELIHFMCVS